MVIKIDRTHESEVDLCRRVLTVYNVVDDWGLTPTQIEILIYIIRFGYDSSTRELISRKVGISNDSLTSSVSYMRKGRIGKRKIKKVLGTGGYNKSKTTLCSELEDVKKFITSNDPFKALYIKFHDNSLKGDEEKEPDTEGTGSDQ